MKKVKIDVHFRKFKGDFADQVTAVFPYQIEDHLNTLCYSHVGQHSACHIDYVHGSKPATESEYQALKQELESIGYELNIIKKRNHKKYLKAYWEKRGAVNISSKNL